MWLYPQFQRMNSYQYPITVENFEGTLHVQGTKTQYICIYLHIKSYIYDHICIHVFYILLQNLDKEGLQACHETYVSNWHPKNRSTPCKINQNNISQRLKAKPDLSQVGVSHPASFAKRFIEMRTEQCSVAIRHPRLLASWGFHGFIMWETASDPWCYGAGLCTLKSSKIQKLSRILHHGAKTYMSLNDFVQGPGSNEENRFSARTADSPPGPSTWPSPWTMSRLTADIERFPHRKRELSTGHVWEIAPRLLQHGANHGKREPIFHVHNQRYFCGIPRSFLVSSSANFQLNHLVDDFTRISPGFPSPLERMAQLWSHSPLRRSAQAAP